jgi:hypothetical protein
MQCDAVARQLANMDYNVTMLHGGKSQDQREESIKVRLGMRGWQALHIQRWKRPLYDLTALCLWSADSCA